MTPGRVCLLCATPPQMPAERLHVMSCAREHTASRSWPQGGCRHPLTGVCMLPASVLTSSCLWCVVAASSSVGGSWCAHQSGMLLSYMGGRERWRGEGVRFVWPLSLLD